MKKDVTGAVADRLRTRLRHFRTRMADTVPYGPAGVGMSDQEVRQRLAGVDPQTKEQMIRNVGDDEWRRIVGDLYGQS